MNISRLSLLDNGSYLTIFIIFAKNISLWWNVMNKEAQVDDGRLEI